MDNTRLRPGLVATKHILNKQRAETIDRVEIDFTFPVSPPETTSSSDSSTHPCVCVAEAKCLHLSHIFLSFPLQPDVPHSFFSDTAAYVNNP